MGRPFWQLKRLCVRETAGEGGFGVIVLTPAGWAAPGRRLTCRLQLLLLTALL